MTQRIQFTVYGIVQGVGFRFFTLHQAQKLKLRGYVKNLSDGSVLTVAEGSEEQLESFYQILQKGPLSSRVERVIKQPYTGDKTFSDFQLIYT